MQGPSVLPPSGGDDGKVLWIGDLPAGLTESALLEVFAHVELESVQLARGIHSGLSLGYGYLSFTSHQAAQAFLLRYNGDNIPGTAFPLKLQWASTEPMTQLTSSTPASDPDSLDSHSLFVGDLPHELSDTELHQHFKAFFPSAKSAKVITDRLSGQSKGYGFVRFTSSEDRDRALSIMHGQKIGQQTIRVNRAKAKKYQGDGLYYPSDHDSSNTTAFVGNVNADITEEDLYNVFRRCGDIVSVKLLKAKGCAFVTYAQRDAAERAITYLHGKVIKNSAVRLCWGRRSLHNSFPIPDPGLMTFAQPSMNPQMPHSSLQSYNSAFSGQAFVPQGALPGSAVFPNQPSFGFQAQPVWRPELAQDFQGQPYGGQLAGFQRMFAQPFLSQSIPNFQSQFGVQQSQHENAGFPAPRPSPGLVTRERPLPLHLDSQTFYGGVPNTSMDFPTPGISATTRAPLRPSTLAETEDALSRLTLGSRQVPSTYS